MAATMYVRSKSNLDVENVGLTAIAVDMGKNSNFAVKWTAENLMKKGASSPCILVHVHNKPAPSQNTNAPNHKDVQQLFLPFRGYFARKGIEVQEVVLFDTDIAKALLEYIAKNSVTNMVIGATNKSAFSRKFWSVSLSTTLLQAAPESCSVYVISKGKVQAMRLANQPPPTPKPSIPTDASRTTTKQSHLHPPSLESDVMLISEYSYSHTSGFSSDQMSVQSSDSSSTSTSTSEFSNGSRLPTSYGKTTPPIHGKPTRFINKAAILDGHRDADFMHDFSESSSSSSSSGVPRSFQSADVSYDNMDFSTISTSSTSSASSSDSMQSMEAEIKRLKVELQQTLDAYNMICKDAEMKMKLQNSRSCELKDVEDSKQAMEPELSTSDMESHRNKAARITELLSEMEAQKKQNAEVKPKHAPKERIRNYSKSMESLAFYNNNMGNHNLQFRKYNIQDIETSTNYFSQSKKIGEGGYGPVYRGVIDEISVAIKVVRPDLSQGQSQFQKEVEVLSTMRHPHMVTLLGACPEYGCLVYEFMENGSLEDRLFRKDNTPPIPWSTRFKIASEIATGLLFLHETRPEPIVHRDLKPANILLDGNLVSKISDVGLARLVPPAAANNVSRYHMTAAAGTFCYIDPEYQQTGLLSVKSDLFSLGVVLLQLITAKTPMGLSYQVEESIEKGRFAAILDPAVKDWPVEEALSLAKLALQCCELRKKDRPSLANVLLPELNRLRDFANGRVGGDQ